MSTSKYITLPKHFPSIEPEREARIHDKIIVDAYGDEEVAMSWYYYLEELLQFPFSAMIQTHKYRQKGGIAYLSVQVRLLGMASLQRCGMHQIWAMGMLAIGREIPLHFLLTDIQSIEPDSSRAQALADWMYWNRHRDFGIYELKK